jgi:hypothetical protein
MAISKIETDSLASGLVAPTATALTTASGSAPSYSARAWVNFNGTGTVAIRASGNVSSITDNGTGNYTVNFTNALEDANFSAVTTIGNTNDSSFNGVFDNSRAFATGSYRFGTEFSGGSAFDPSACCVTIFR